VFRRRKREEDEQGMGAEAFTGLRAKLLAADPEEFGLVPTERFPNVWVVLMELGMAGGIASIVCVADGTTSMYTSTGGGMIGAGAHPNVVEANALFLDEVERSLPLLPPVEELQLPQPEMVRFNALTYSGPRTAAGIPDELVQGGRPLSPLFLAGNEVITQLRMV
jgi:hypothetical protein